MINGMSNVKKKFGTWNFLLILIFRIYSSFDFLTFFHRSVEFDKFFEKMSKEVKKKFSKKKMFFFPFFHFFCFPKILTIFFRNCHWSCQGVGKTSFLVFPLFWRDPELTRNHVIVKTRGSTSIMSPYSNPCCVCKKWTICLLVKMQHKVFRKRCHNFFRFKKRDRENSN